MTCFNLKCLSSFGSFVTISQDTVQWLPPL